jgi:hypothetical protein
MPEWWTYRLSDLLLFSPRTYYRMFELYHGAIWPVHIIVLASALSIVVLARRVDSWAQRTIAGVTAAWWLWVGVAFHLNRYATINWSAKYFAGLFVTQAMLLVWYGVVRAELRFELPRSTMQRFAAGLIVLTALYPLFGRLAGRQWNQVELPGLTPDPTAIATLALLAITVSRVPRPLLVIPAVWCVIGAATLWALGSVEAWVVIFLGLAGLVLAMRNKRSGNRQTFPRTPVHPEHGGEKHER